MVITYPKFNALKSDKRERIINAAFREFAQNGYSKASTNEIIKNAEIAKGSLFSYFNSKKELYLYLIKYSVKVINKIYDEIDWNERDIFNRIKQIGLIKYKIMKKYPQVFDFLNKVANEKTAEAESEIEKISKNGFEKLYKNIDWTKFRDDIDIQKAVNVINWTMKCFSEEGRDKINSFEDINTDKLAEWDAYSDLFRRCFYKKEEP